jgi:hypothetical protein
MSEAVLALALCVSFGRLKNIFQDAAMRASTAAEPLRDFCEVLLVKGKRPMMARLTLARISSFSLAAMRSHAPKPYHSRAVKPRIFRPGI